MAGVPRIPGLTTTSLIAGALVTIPGTLGLVLGRQIVDARRGGFLPRPDYTVDITVSPPWVSGPVLSVAFLGDSLVEGVGAPRASQSLPAQTAYRLAAHLGRPVRMRSLGIASSKIADVIEHQVPQLTADVDLVVVLIGANDATTGTAPWDFARLVEQLTVAAHEATAGAPVVFTGLPDIQSAPLLARPLRDIAGLVGDRLHAVQRRLAQRLPEARYIDVRCEIGDTVRRRGRELFAADRYHLNPAGYALLGEAVARSLTRLLVEEHGLRRHDLDEAELAAIHAAAMAEVADLPGLSPAPAA